MTDLAQIRLGLIGWPLGHSLSPFLHHYLLKESNQMGCYHAFEIKKEQLTEAVQGLQTLGFKGFNVTIPYKQLIMSHLDEISEEAQWIGAVNTVLIKNSKRYGFNTDGRAFNLALQNKQINPAGKTAIVLGAGGAARAVILSLVKNRIHKIEIFNRTLKRAEQLTEEISKTTNFKNLSIKKLQESKITRSLESVQLIINATALGMWPEIETAPYSFNSEFKHLTAIDLVYNPLETKFLKNAQAAGAKIVDGLDMFIFQGRESLNIWTENKMGFDFNLDEIRTYLIEKLKNYEQS
ncbi:MAG: shikimate dehydrogenase [bacterium]